MLCVIDDNVDDIELVRIALDSLGYPIDITEVRDGENALDMLRDGQCRPDIVLLDLKLPGISGADVLCEIRADERMRNLPVFIVSSSNMDADKEEAMRSGADGYIHKSFNLDNFIIDIGTALNRCLGIRA